MKHRASSTHKTDVNNRCNEQTDKQTNKQTDVSLRPFVCMSVCVLYGV